MAGGGAVVGSLATRGRRTWPRAVLRVVGGIEGEVVGMACGQAHSLVATAEGRVLVFGSGRDGRLGLGAGMDEALTPTAIDGITIGDEEEGKEGKE